MEMREHQRNNSWLREVQLYMEEYNITQGDLKQNNYKAVVDRKINIWEREVWEREAEGNPRLKHYATIQWDTPAPNLNNSEKSQRLCQARVGDMYSIAGEDKPKLCGMCSKEKGRRNMVDELLIAASSTGS